MFLSNFVFTYGDLLLKVKHILCEMENCTAQWNFIVVYVIYILKLPSCLRIKVIIMH